MAKAKKGIQELLIRHICNDLLNGAVQSVLLEKIQDDTYGVGKTYQISMARQLIALARKRIREDWKEESKELREMQLNRILDLYTESREIGDRMSALKSLQEINKISGLYEPTKVDMKVGGSIDISFGFENNEENEDMSED